MPPTNKRDKIRGNQQEPENLQNIRKEEKLKIIIERINKGKEETLKKKKRKKIKIALIIYFCFSELESINFGCWRVKKIIIIKKVLTRIIIVILIIKILTRFKNKVMILIIIELIFLVVIVIQGRTTVSTSIRIMTLTTFIVLDRTIGISLLISRRRNSYKTIQAFQNI